MGILMNKPANITLRDLALELGVSVAAISRALNDLPGVSDELRQKVKETAVRMGYNKYLRSTLVNAYERSMKFIAVIYGSVGGAILSEIDQSLSARIRQLGFHELRYVVDTGKEWHTEAARQLFFDRFAMEKGVVGALLYYVRLSDAMILNLYQRDLPVVLIETFTEFGRCVVIDHVGSSRMAVERMIACGRSKIGCVVPAEDEDRVWRERLLGYKEALRNGGLPYDPSLVVHPPWVGVPPGVSATGELLERHPDVDGILYGSDTLAAGGLKALAQQGRTVPDDVAVIGFDDAEFAEALSPSLSSVRQPFRKIAVAAADLLFETLDHGVTDHRLIEFSTELIERESSGPRPGTNKPPRSARRRA
jgi:LacI family transcriptional regulator